jgi:hypothetical protein
MLTPIIYKKKTKMKKVLLTVITFALITSSCNKYKDDFKNLNAKIDALATQVAAVSTLQTSIQAIQTTLGQLQTAVAAIPNNTAAINALSSSLQTLTNTVGAIQTKLNTMADAYVNDRLNTAQMLTDIKNAQIANQNATILAIGNLNSAIAQLKIDLTASINSKNDAQTVALTNSINSLQTALTTLINANKTAIDAANAALANTATTTQLAALQATIALMQADLAVVKAQVALLLASNNFFVGNLLINDETTLVAAENLGAKVLVITGNVTIDASTFSATQLTRLKNVTNGTAYIGSVVGNVTLQGSKVIDLGKLGSVSGDGVATGHLNVSGSAHILSALANVAGNYTLTTDAVDDAVVTVGKNLSLNYAGSYSYPALTTVGGTLTATDFATTPFTTSVSFPALSTASILNSGAGNGVLTYSKATSIVIGASSGLTSLTAPVATAVTLGEKNYAGGLTISAPAASASNVNLSAMITAVGPISVTTKAATTSTLDLTSFTGNGNNTITVVNATTLNMPQFTGTGGASQTLNSGTVKTATLAKWQGTTSLSNLTALENLTVGDLQNPLNGVIAGTLKTLDVTGSAYTASVSLPGFTALTSVKTAGLLSSLVLTGNTALTSVVTAGQMDWFQLDGATVLTGVTLGHNFVSSALGQGTTVIVTNNPVLASLTTSTSRMKQLTVTNNALLATANFASYVAGDNITAGAVTIAVHTNLAMKGTYTNSIFATTTAPVMVQSSLSTLKAYAVNLLNSGAHTVTLNLGYYVGATELTTLMDADLNAYITAGGTAATSFVNRTGDNGGAAGTRINVLREINYLQ